MTNRSHDELEARLAGVPRRRVLQTLLGGTLTLAGLAGCGGGGEDEDEEDNEAAGEEDAGNEAADAEEAQGEQEEEDD